MNIFESIFNRDDIRPQKTEINEYPFHLDSKSENKHFQNIKKIFST